MMKKWYGALLCAVLVLNSTAGVRAEDQDFDEFLTEEFVESMESDYMTLHYGVRDYGKYGIEKPELIFGTATKESYDEAGDIYREALDTLHSFNYDKLSAEQQVDYRVYEKYLTDIIGLNNPLLDAYFNPNTGILDNIVTNFTEFVFRDQEDFDDYLAVLDTVDEYMDEAIELTKWQASEGVFLRDSLLDEAEDWIRDFLDKGEECPMIVIFDQKVDAFDGLSTAERDSYKKRNRDIVLNVVFPAYRKAWDELEKLRGSGRYEGGMVNYPGGEEYYRSLVSYKTSSSMSVEEQVEFLDGVLEEGLGYYMVLYFSAQDIFDRYEEVVDFDSAEDILNYHQAHVKEQYPDGPEVVYEVSYLDPSVANDSTMAYYMEPPIDDIRDNVVRINGDLVSDTNTMYETLAHEGFPGHLYQITWYLNTKPHPARSTMRNMGYTEGWGMYGELSSWEYSGLDEDVALMHEIDTMLGYVFNAYCDLGVNGLGWTVSDLKVQMDEHGFNGEMAQDMYDFVIDAPGQILPYGVGLAQFLALRSMTAVSMGSDFDLRKFNEVLLTNGDRPFDLVEEDLVQYIEKSGHQVSEDFTYLDCWFDQAMKLPGVNQEMALQYIHHGTEMPRSKTPFIIAGVGAVIVLALAVLLIRNSRKKTFGDE
ncbi:MAG: DUF885 domain-containing protein [Solobacterium sp.]|nr:DUF885 domain-containing protein [Solobacterium sp.]MBQ1446109.1 DUF885 domain-containing protein [Solobacterium sp.]